MDRTKIICQRYFFQILIRSFRSRDSDVDLMLFQKPTGIIQPFGRVMVSGNEKHRDLRCDL